MWDRPAKVGEFRVWREQEDRTVHIFRREKRKNSIFSRCHKDTYFLSVLTCMVLNLSRGFRLLCTFPPGCTVGRCPVEALVGEDTEDRKRQPDGNNGNR